MIFSNKFIFRFTVIFFVLLLFPFPLNVISKIDFISKPLTGLYQTIIPWIGKNILGLEKEITTFTNGSGDTTYDYVLILFFIILSILLTIIWTIFSKNRFNYEKINYWFLVLLRYYLAYMMLSYGMYKIIQLQFPQPSFYRLLEPFGDASPMGLAWAFLGYSKGYNLFMGLAEVIGGVLLFHRRTTLLGCLVLVGVLANVVALNFFYDIPVKLFSSQLLVMTIIILLPDVRRLMNVILLNKPTAPKEFFSPYTSKKWSNGTLILKSIIILFLCYTEVSGAIESNYSYGQKAPKPELYGLYTSTDFIKNSDTIPPILTDTIRWRHLRIEYLKSMQIYAMDNSTSGYKSSIDTLKQNITLTEYRDSTKTYTFNYSKTDSTLVLKGIFKGDTIEFHGTRRTKDDFLLTKRGFRWINEYPFNR